MLGVLVAVLGVSLLVSSCGSDASSSASPGTGAGGSGFNIGTGGASNDGYGGNGALNGGLTVGTPELLASIKNAACSSWSSELELAPSLLEFVVDTSGSMLELAPQSKESKWVVTRDAIGSAITKFLPDETALGVLFFPNQATIPNALASDVSSQPLPVSECINIAAMVKVGPLGAQGSVQRAALSQSLANVQPAGGTPTDDAYTYALSNGIEPAIRTYAGYVPYMVLITDGQPTILQGCKGTGETAHPVDWTPIVEHIREAADLPNAIKTFVIGSPGSKEQSTTGDDGRPWLSQAARVGKTQRSEDCSDEGPNYCHYDLSESSDLATDLSDGLRDIMRKIPCRFSMPSAPPNCVLEPAALNVIYEQGYASGVAQQTWIIGQSEISCGNGGTADGWYVDPNTNMIVLCPTTCQTVQSDQRARLQILSGCHTIASPIQ
jgi:hypothetical protein